MLYGVHTTHESLFCLVHPSLTSLLWRTHPRSALLFTNTVLGLVGLLILAYAALAYIEYECAIKPPSGHQEYHQQHLVVDSTVVAHDPSTTTTRSESTQHTILYTYNSSNTTTPHPWFVEATAAAGALTVVTAALGMLAGCHPNVWTLNTYSFSLSAVVIGMGAAGVGVFWFGSCPDLYPHPPICMFACAHPPTYATPITPTTYPHPPTTYPHHRPAWHAVHHPSRPSVEAVAPRPLWGV